MTFGCGPHQGCLLVFFLRINAGASGQQCLHGSDPAGARRGHQNRFPAAKRGVRVRACTEEQLDQLGVSIHASHGEWRYAVAVLRLNIRAGGDKKFRGFHIVPVGRPMQRRHPVNLRRVHVGVLLEHRADRCAI